MINNKRKEILKRGVDVTLYPLPFRKGGKIANIGLGDKNTKPGIEFADGGQIPGIGALRKKNPDAFAAEQYKKSLGKTYPLQFAKGGLMSAFTGGENDKPKQPAPYIAPDGTRKFKDKGEFDQHHLNLAVQKLQTDDPMLYERYQQEMASGNSGNAYALIATKGGLPQYVQPSTPSTLQPTNWKNIGFSGAQKTGGYRYNAGPGKPAEGATTNASLGMRRSKFRK
jgi:hypothetical protein